MTTVQPFVAEDAVARASTNFAELGLDSLWQLREQVDAELRDLRDYRTGIDAELDRRFKAASPEFGEESGGSAELAGRTIAVRLSYVRDYAWDSGALTAVLQARDDAGRPLLTEAEWDKLVKIEMTGNSTAYNALLKRGGVLAELLAKARILKRATPKFEAVKRS